LRFPDTATSLLRIKLRVDDFDNRRAKRKPMMTQRIAFAHERRVVGTLLLNLLFAIFEHNGAHLKRHFGASLDTMAVGIAVLLAQLASRPASASRLAQLLGVPRRAVVHKVRELAAAGVLIKQGSHYVANYEVFAAADPETAVHINRMKEAILSACEKLGHSGP
jgi:biotin operon repressor